MPAAQRPRILILVENLPVPFDRRVWMEASTLQRAGYGVSVICPRGHYRRYHETIEGIRIYRYPLPSLRGGLGHLVEYALALIATSLLTLAVLWRDGFDVIQSANPPDFFFLIAAPLKLIGKKFVFDHHDLMPEICESRWRGWQGRLLRRLCLITERASFRTADRVIANNESYRRVALNRGGVRADHIAVVRSAPSLRQFMPPPPRPELRAGADHLVVYLGVMGPNDGLDCLLQAIAHIVHQRQRRNIRFVLIGSGDLYEQTVTLSRRLQLTEHVQFTGRIADEAVLEWLSTADLTVAPDPKDALNDISSMNKIVEYMALGKAIVAFDLREVRISAVDAAVYVAANDPAAFGDAVVQLIDAPERRQAMGRSGRQRFESVLAWEHQEKALLQLYDGLCTDHPTAGSTQPVTDSEARAPRHE